MALHIYNSLTEQKEPFKPEDPQEVRIYNCGPTVYNLNHIGNFRSYMFVDILRRYLKLRNYGLNHTSNITDVDDKIIENAMQQGKTIADFTRPFIEAFFQDLSSINIEEVENRPKATEHIDSMLTMIDALQKHGHTYEIDGNVYFRIDTFPGYGALSRIDPATLKTAAGGRFESDEYTKEDVRDFALWKAPTEEKEPCWNSKYGCGRPGWHLECSAMIREIYGDTGIDIHIGGVDLIFPHHENEIAQSQAAYPDDRFVKYWMHNEHLLVDGKKMSKSAGNFYMLRDFTDEQRLSELVQNKRAPEFTLHLLESGRMHRALRYVLLDTHYRARLNFTFEHLHAADAAVCKIQNCVHTLMDQIDPASVALAVSTQAQLAAAEMPGSRPIMNSEAGARSELEQQLHDLYSQRQSLSRPGSGGEKLFHWPEIQKTFQRFCEAMDDDLNISVALSQVFALLKYTAKIQEEGERIEALLFLYAINQVLAVLDFGPKENRENAEMMAEIERAIEERKTAKKNRDFARADEIRDDLLGRGIRLKDTVSGTTWEKI